MPRRRRRGCPQRRGSPRSGRSARVRSSSPASSSLASARAIRPATSKGTRRHAGWLAPPSPPAVARRSRRCGGALRRDRLRRAAPGPCRSRSAAASPVFFSFAVTCRMPSRSSARSTMIGLPAGARLSPTTCELADLDVLARVLVLALEDVDLDRVLVVERSWRTSRSGAPGSACSWDDRGEAVGVEIAVQFAQHADAERVGRRRRPAPPRLPRPRSPPPGSPRPGRRTDRDRPRRAAPCRRFPPAGAGPAACAWRRRPAGSRPPRTPPSRHPSAPHGPLPGFPR